MHVIKDFAIHMKPYQKHWIIKILSKVAVDKIILNKKKLYASNKDNK